MATTKAAKPKDTVEVWKNVARGFSWITKIAPNGSEMAEVVHAGRIFTITPYERQINQWKAATPEQDLFRNGRFLLVQAAEETNHDEIESVESMTDAELAEIALMSIDDPEIIDERLRNIKSAVTLTRLLDTYEQYDKVPEKVIKKTKEALKEVRGGPEIVERTVVS